MPSNTEYAELIERLTEALPILDGLETGRDCEEYAFATGNGFQAMTHCPHAFEALRCIPNVITALERLSSDREMMREALDRISRGKYDGMEVTHMSAMACRHIARDALSHLTGEG